MVCKKNEGSDNVIVSKDPECKLDIPEAVADSCFIRTDDGFEVTITGYENSCSKNVIIPSQLDGLSVGIIGDFSFEYQDLTSVSIPNSVHTIEGWSFVYNQLSKVIIPNSVTFIGEEAFHDNNISILEIPSSVITINIRAFNDNLLPDDNAFIYARNPDGSQDLSKIIGYGGAKRSNVIIPDTVVTLGEYSLSWVFLESVIIPTSVQTIENSAFRFNDLSNISIPNSVTSIGANAFSSNQLTSITIPSNVTIQTNSISSTFNTAYVTVNARAAGTYTSSSQTGTWTKQ